jgi:hypothetical protein
LVIFGALTNPTVIAQKHEYITTVNCAVAANNPCGAFVCRVNADDCFEIRRAGGTAFFNDDENVNEWAYLLRQFSLGALAQAFSDLAGKVLRRRGLSPILSAATSFLSAFSRHDRMREDIRHVPNNKEWSPGGAYLEFLPDDPDEYDMPTVAWVGDVMYNSLNHRWLYCPRADGVFYLVPNDGKHSYGDNTGLYWIELRIYRESRDDENRVRYYELEEDN